MSRGCASSVDNLGCLRTDGAVGTLSHGHRHIQVTTLLPFGLDTTTTVYLHIYYHNATQTAITATPRRNTTCDCTTPTCDFATPTRDNATNAATQSATCSYSFFGTLGNPSLCFRRLLLALTGGCSFRRPQDQRHGPWLLLDQGQLTTILNLVTTNQTRFKSL